LIRRILPRLPREGPSGSRREEVLYLGAALRLAVKDQAPNPPPGSTWRSTLHRPCLPDRRTSRARGVPGRGRRSGGIPVSRGGGFRKPGGILRRQIYAGLGPVPVRGCRWRAPGIVASPFRRLVPLRGPVAFRKGGRFPLGPRVEGVAPGTAGRVPPRESGTCGGKVLLTALWEAEEKRGEASRAAEVRDAAARRFPSDANAAALEWRRWSRSCGSDGKGRRSTAL